MSNVECNVVRDLMPLCIDGAASEESRSVVVDHVWKCEKCAEVYKAMQGHMLPGCQDDTDALDAAARKLYRKRKNRKRFLVTATCVVTACVVLLAVLGFDFATTRSIVPVSLDEYDAYLSRSREGGKVFLTYEMKNEYLQYGRSMGGSVEADGYILRYSATTTMIRGYSDYPNPRVITDEESWYWIDGKIYTGDPATTKPVQSIRLVCGDEERIIYQMGDDIPLCSEEMEAYYAAWDAYHDYNTPTNRRDFEFEDRRKELMEKAAELYPLVPEWQ